MNDMAPFDEQIREIGQKLDALITKSGLSDEAIAALVNIRFDLQHAHVEARSARRMLDEVVAMAREEADVAEISARARQRVLAQPDEPCRILAFKPRTTHPQFSPPAA